jgi:hypothetical protein
VQLLGVKKEHISGLESERDPPAGKNEFPAAEIA